MPNITNHQRNANQNFSGIPYYIHQDKYYVLKNRHSIGENAVELKHLYPVCGWEPETVQLLWKSGGLFPPKLNVKLSCDSVILLGLCSKELKAGSRRDILTSPSSSPVPSSLNGEAAPGVPDGQGARRGAVCTHDGMLCSLDKEVSLT